MLKTRSPTRLPKQRQKSKRCTTRTVAKRTTTTQPVTKNTSENSTPPKHSPDSETLQKIDPSETPTPPHSPISKKPKKWLVSWGNSTTNGLGRDTDMDWDPHPQRVLVPSLKGDLYQRFSPELDDIHPLSEDKLADIDQIASGWSTNLASTTEGRIFQWGYRNPTRSMIHRINSKGKITGIIGNFVEDLIGYHPWSIGSEKLVRIPCFGAENDDQLRQEASDAGFVVPDWLTAADMQKIVKVQTAADNRGALTSTGYLFTWSEVGDNYGSIGQGSQYSTNANPGLIPIPDIVDFSFGYNNLSFVTKSGTLYSCGNTEGGATGLPMAFLNLAKNKMKIFKPLSVHTNYEKFIEDLKHATRAFTSNGQAPIVQQKESDPNINTDILNNEEYAYKMRKPLKKIDLSQFQNRDFQTKKITPNREVDSYSHEFMRLTGSDLIANIVQFVNWRGVEGKEGAIDPMNLLHQDKLVSTLPKFTTVASGFAHTLVLDEDGHAWAHGRNAHGELGHTLDPFTLEGRGDVKQHNIVNTGLKPVDFRTYYFPMKVEALQDVKLSKISAGLHHSAVLSKDGDVYTFGSNDFGQCGRLNELPSTLRSVTLGHKQPWSLPPGKLYISPNVLNGAKVVDVVCGFYDTALTLSDGRCLIAGGYLSKEGQPRRIFSLKEFDPSGVSLDTQNESEGDETGSEGYSESESSGDEFVKNEFIQVIPSREMVPRSIYAETNRIEKENIDNGERKMSNIYTNEAYSLKSITFGWQHVLAIATPRNKAKGVEMGSFDQDIKL